jgi:hypothetical protein
MGMASDRDAGMIEAVAGDVGGRDVGGKHPNRKNNRRKRRGALGRKQ